VLVLLLERPGEVLTKDELIGAAWSNTPEGASDNSLTTAIRKLRAAVGGSRDEVILTVPNVGYRMAVPVVETLVAATQAPVLQLKGGDPIPRRANWKAQRPLDAAQTVWLAEHSKTHEVRVFKFAVDGVRLRALQREVTLSRLLQKSLADTRGFVRVMDWALEELPYFTESEYGGVNLLELAETEQFKSLTLEARVALAAELAETVAAAHSLGILHNDLKPSNVLILENVDGLAGSLGIKVADFGVASLTQPERLRQMEITQHGFAEGEQPGATPVGTGMYRAPEILAGGAASTLADVHALGVMLYQIVCGDFVEPLSPGWESRIADPLLREDIAAAANIDPAQRIATAADLAARLRTIEARRAEKTRREAEISHQERNRRDLERERLRRPWIAFAMLALIVGLCASLWFARRADHARKQAEADAAHARRLEKFTENLFTSGDDRMPAKDLKVETLLERGVKSARALNNDRPAQAEMLHTLAMVYEDLGLFDKAQQLFADALREREQVFGPNSAEVAGTLTEFSAMRDEQGQEDQALALAERAVNIDARTLPPSHPQTLRAQTKLGLALVGLGQYEKAEAILQAVVEKERGNPGELADLSDALGGLASVELYLGHNAEALRLTDEGLVIDRQRLGDKHPDVASDLIDKAQLENVSGDYARSEADAREALAIYRGWFAPGHYEIAGAETTLSDPLIQEGKAQEALALLTDALRIQQAKFAGPNDREAHTLAALGSAERTLHHYDAALAYYQRAAEQYRALFPARKDYRLASMLHNEGTVYMAETHLPQAESVLREAVQIDADRLPANDKRSLDTQILLAQVLLAEHRPAEANPLLNQVLKNASAGGAALQAERDQASKALQSLASAAALTTSGGHS
jgi:non-specific serine/threonine protein kinase